MSPEHTSVLVHVQPPTQEHVLLKAEIPELETRITTA